MTFAQSLAQKADDFEKKLDAKEALEIQTWAAEMLDRIKAECTRASEQGHYDYSGVTTVCQEARKGNRGLAKKLLEQHLRGLGFNRVRVADATSPAADSIVMVKDLAPGEVCFRMEGSWKLVSRSATSTSAEPAAKRLKGHLGRCQLCEENRSMIALAPCGHVLCGECREKQVFETEATKQRI
eukprot:s601_g19.t1